MNIDFTHNQIIRDTITNSFIESFSDGLVPYLVSEYGSSLDEIQFYEDHLTEGLRINGEFFYPLTVVVGGTPRTRFIKWQVSNYRNYDKFNPFSYKGREPLEFELVDEPSDELLSVCAGKRIYAAPGTAVPVLLTSTSEEKTFLAGKYSQSFIDLLAQKLTSLIEKEFSVSGLSSSGVVLELRFEPGTFMEHVVASTTYRRLLIKARGCAPRDLWIKWTRLDGMGVYTVSDNVSESAIEFSLAEDVPGKIREKEYRYLTATDTNKYQAAMSRKNITEWRDVMRRVIRRGEVSVNESDEFDTATPPETLPEDEIAYTPLITETAAPKTSTASDLDALLASLDIEDDESKDTDEVDEELEALLQSAIGITSSTAAYTEEDIESDEEAEAEASEAEIPTAEPTDEVAPVIPEPVRVETIYSTPKIDEERIRYEIEARLRAEMEEKLKKKEQEAEELRARLAAKEKEDERERLRLAEAAREALRQKERLEAEAREREALERAEAEKRAEEERRAAEEAKLLAEREAEAARLLREQEAREKAEAEERAKREAEATVYVSRTVKLFFKQQIDPEITKRIHEIILATIKYYHKEDVYIKIKANIPDITTVHLEFVKIPEAEIPLLVNIIKVLGRSGLGITRAILD